MRRVRWCDSLRGQMPADVEICGIFSLLNGLMILARFGNRGLLRSAVFVKRAIARFEFASDPSDIFFRRVQLRLPAVKCLLRLTTRLGAAQSSARNLFSLARQARPACSEIQRARGQI